MFISWHLQFCVLFVFYALLAALSDEHRSAIKSIKFGLFDETLEA